MCGVCVGKAFFAVICVWLVRIHGHRKNAKLFLDIDFSLRCCCMYECCGLSKALLITFGLNLITDVSVLELASINAPKRASAKISG